VAMISRGSRRRSTVPRVLRLVALLAALVAAGAAPVRAQEFLEAYRAGLDAVERQDWSAAETLMAEAAADRPEASQRLARYLYFKPYIPHYYLGLARFRQGDCPGALEAWEESERQDFVRSDADAWGILTEGRAECAQRREAADRAQQVATELEGLLDRVRRAIAEAAQLAPRAESAGIWREGRPSPADLLDSARQSLSDARRVLDRQGDGELEPQAADQVRRLARMALSNLDALRSRLDNLERQVLEQRGSERQRLEALQRAARRLLDQTEELAAEIPIVAQERGALATALDAAESASGGTVPVDVLANARNRLASAVETLRRTAEPPPQPLVDGAEAYFSGELERAVELLSELDTSTPEEDETARARRTRAHAALLRGAARFSLWQMGGAADIELLEAARHDVRTAREADPDLTPLPRAFSPRFLAFFEANLPEDAEQPSSDE